MDIGISEIDSPILSVDIRSSRRKHELNLKNVTRMDMSDDSSTHLSPEKHTRTQSKMNMFGDDIAQSLGERTLQPERKLA